MRHAARTIAISAALACGAFSLGATETNAMPALGRGLVSTTVDAPRVQIQYYVEGYGYRHRGDAYGQRHRSYGYGYSDGYPYRDRGEGGAYHTYGNMRPY